LKKNNKNDRRGGVVKGFFFRIKMKGGGFFACVGMAVILALDGNNIDDDVGERQKKREAGVDV